MSDDDLIHVSRSELRAVLIRSRHDGTFDDVMRSRGVRTLGELVDQDITSLIRRNLSYNSSRTDYQKVSPNALAAYLRINGWSRISSHQLVSVWRRDGRDILAPVVSDLDDYDEVIESAISRLSTQLKRSPELVLQDLLAVVYDPGK